MVFKYPEEELTVVANIKNTSNIPYTFKVGVSIGKTDVVWYDTTQYTDGLGDYVDIALAPGQTGAIQRTMRMPNDAAVTDVWIQAKDPVTLEVYGSRIFAGMLTLAQVSVDIVSVDVL